MKFQILASLALALSSASAFTISPLSRVSSRVPFTVSKMSDVAEAEVETEVPSTPTFRAGENIRYCEHKTPLCNDTRLFSLTRFVQSFFKSMVYKSILYHNPISIPTRIKERPSRFSPHENLLRHRLQLLLSRVRVILRVILNRWP